MLPASVKAGIKKVAAKVASGEMKPGDTMVMANKPEEDMEESDMSPDEGDMSEEFHSLAMDMMECFEKKDVSGLSSLLEEFCQHCKNSY